MTSEHKAAQEQAVINALKTTQGYFTVFWATETQYRAAAIERLEARGAIRVERLGFPLLRAVL